MRHAAGRGTRRAPARASRLITPSLLRRMPLPGPSGELGKEDRGTVLVVGGSNEVPGAAILAAVAALRAGAGKLQIATTRDAAVGVAVAVPEARVVRLPQRPDGEPGVGAARFLDDEVRCCDALVVGPGMGNPHAAVALLTRAARQTLRATCVVDAIALAFFGGSKPFRATRAVFKGGVIATPHAGEMARLRGIERDEVLARPLEIAREAARELGVVLVLKGPCTYVVAPDGTAFHNTAGNSGLGTSGSGDTLSGVIGGLAARGAPPLDAAVWGVYLHASAGDVLARKMGPLGFLARDLLAEIPPLMAKLSRP